MIRSREKFHVENWGLEFSNAKICATHQGCGRAEVRIFTCLLQDGSDLVLREVASFDVSTDHCGHEASFVLQLGGHGPLVRPRSRALLHRGQNAGLFPLGHAPESHS